MKVELKVNDKSVQAEIPEEQLKETVLFEQLKISTHTLRGERDAKELGINANTDNFNSHAPWGA